MVPADPPLFAAPTGPARSSASAGSIDSPAMRQAGREMLSLALIDSRNLTLQTLTAILHAQDAALDTPTARQQRTACGSPLWIAGHIGWFAERWIGRNTQRALGSRCPPQPTRIGSIEPDADAFWDPAQNGTGDRPQPALPDSDATRSYLLETLEGALALLEKVPEDDDALYFFRAALAYEDTYGERLVVAAQTLGLALPLPAPAGLHLREPLGLPATRWRLGSEPGGFVPAIEQWAHDVEVPEFEIDAQPVTWAQFVEFVDDGGYDSEELWSAAGWAWLKEKEQKSTGRRGPRHVEQIGAARFGGSGAVLQSWFGRGVRLGHNQQVMHASWFEADAWARWAGRRLPSEVEWEVAALTANRRGWRWGDVHEWTSTTLRPWPGYVADPFALDAEVPFGQAKVLRGASLATRLRQQHPKFRRYALPQHDEAFVGFRSCAI